MSENQDFAIFDQLLNDFGRSDDDVIRTVKKLWYWLAQKILNGIYLPDHLVMSAQECIQLYDALECVLGREKSSSLEPSVILGERLLKKKDVLEYVETLKKFVCSLILDEQAGLEMFERLKTELTPSNLG